MLDWLKFSQKIVLMPALAAAAFVLVILVVQLTSRHSQELLGEIESGYTPAFELSRDLEAVLAEIQRGLQDAAAIRDESLLDATDELAGSFLALLEQGRGIATLEAGELRPLQRQFAAYYRSARDVTRRMIAEETGIRLARDLEAMRGELNAVQRDVEAFSVRQRQEMAAAFGTAQRNQRWSLWGTSAVTATCLLALVTLSLGVVGSLNRQLGQAVAVADSMARDEEVQVATVSKDEIGHLLLRMSHMVVRVRERTRQLEHEVTERGRAEAALRESEERYALAARGANDGLWDWDLRADRVYLSPRWRQMLGDGGEGDADPEVWLGRIHPDDREAVEGQLDNHLAGLAAHFETEHRIRHSDGTYRWVLARGLAVRDEEGRCLRLAGSMSDINERKRSESQLLHDAFHDGLTGLPNRALFLDRLGQALRHSLRRDEAPCAVLFLDLDRFKLINDSLGHAAGDRLLTLLARRLEECVRPEDTVARLGGDEFAILLEMVGDANTAAVRAAERAQAAISRAAAIDGHEMIVTASIGIALSSSGYERPEDMLRDADTAMYRAKALGKARHAIFDAEMHARSMALLALEMDLRRAVERHELQVQYQPIVGLSDGRLIGFEALVRWQHPERGLVMPGEFIALAEETGLIVPLCYQVLDMVADQLRRWRGEVARRQLFVSVNLSARQLVEGELVKRLSDVFGGDGLGGAGLRFEITESVLMEDTEAAVRVLHELRELDVRLYVDDFGTGYSSLAYLHRLPIDALKIDRSFVQRLRRDGGDGQVVRAIVTLAHSLGMEVVGEGVEHRHQLAQLRALGCEAAQGHLFAPPLDPDAAGELLARGGPFSVGARAVG